MSQTGSDEDNSEDPYHLAKGFDAYPGFRYEWEEKGYKEKKERESVKKILEGLIFSVEMEVAVQGFKTIGRLEDIKAANDHVLEIVNASMQKDTNNEIVTGLKSAGVYLKSVIESWKFRGARFKGIAEAYASIYDTLKLEIETRGGTT